MRHLFICTVGPVQDFIKTARRSRDLWYGSWMLSELSKAAALEIANLYTLDALIFPAPDNLDLLSPASELNVSNKILAFIETDTPQEIANKVKSATDARLQSLKVSAFKRIKGEYDQENADIQVKDLLEFYWVATLCEKDENYLKARELVEQMLSARKNTRNFKQLTGNNNPKSSLDGNRESVIPEDQYPVGGASENSRQEKSSLLYQNYGARPAERLSGVDLLKRLGNSPREKTLAKFNSTSHFASLPYIAMLNRQKENKADNLLSAIEKEYRKIGWKVADVPKDGALLYESRITDVVPRGKEQDQLKEVLGKLLQEQAGDTRPSPYYALLRADGDNMGTILDAQKTPAQHREFSKALSDFAKLVPVICEKHGGRAIFSGGDDVLAYLPLHTTLECLEDLEKSFRETVPAKKFHAERDGENTLSGGLVIAHHLSSLSEVLALSREAEVKAKEVKGKNALVIVLNKRSGVEREITGKWQDLSQRLSKLVTFYREKSISKGTAHELHTLHNTFSGITIDKKAIEAEALRIVKRKKESGGGENISEKTLETVKTWLKNEDISLDELAQEMIAAGVFAQAMNTAFGEEVHP